MSKGRTVLGSSDITWDEKEDRPRKIRGEFILPKVSAAESTNRNRAVAGDETNQLEHSVKTFLQNNSKDLGFVPSSENLKIIQNVSTPTRRIIRFQQLNDGKPVLDSTMTVQLDRNNKVKQLDLGHASKTNIIQPTIDSKINAEEAIRVASDSLGKYVSRQEPKEPEQVYYPTKDGLKLAYIVLMPTRDPPHDWRIIVDAYSGMILEKRDLVVRISKENLKKRTSRTNLKAEVRKDSVNINGQGLVFDPNPVVTANDNTLRDPDAAQSCGFSKTSRMKIDAQRASRVLKDITFSDGKYRLEGPYVKMRNFADPAISPPEESDANNFKYSSADPKFGDVNVYYHVDTCQRYIQSLGITTAHNSVIEADAHDDSIDAAWYSPIDKGLHFSNSGPCNPDRAQDGDCMTHEYGHAIQDDQVPGWGVPNPGTGRDETGAMGEGFGDILACVFFAQHGGGYQREVFEDWVFGDRDGLRHVNGAKVYPKDWKKEVHADGEIWSAALWNIYRTIGGDSGNPTDIQAARDALIKTVILSHHHLTPDAAMSDGAEAVMETNAELDDYRGKHLMQMLDSFHDRGLLVCSTLSDLYIRDAPDDTGGDQYLGSVFWNSPDIWIRNADDGGFSHQDPKSGQDNWFYARIHNRGTITARAFVVTFNVKPWSGMQFVYPQDFVPYVSATVGFNLPAGESTIVKAKWPASLVPPTDNHGAVLASVYTPTDVSPTGRHIWEYNNLAQKNLVMVDLLPNDSVLVPFQLGNLHLAEPEIHRLEIRRPQKWSDSLSISIVSKKDPAAIKEMFNSINEAKVTSTDSNISKVQSKSIIRFLEPTRVEIFYAGLKADPVVLNLNKESTLDISSNTTAKPQRISQEFTEKGREADLMSDQTGASYIEFHSGALAGIPIKLRPRSPINLDLRIRSPAEAKPGDVEVIHLVQRNTKGKVVGGITIQMNIKERSN